MSTSTLRNSPFLQPARRAFREIRRRFNRMMNFRQMRKLSPTLTARVVQLPHFRICVDTHDTQISEIIERNKAWEVHVTQALHALLKPGMTFLDIGANIGYHTMTGAHLVGPGGRVHAIEMAPPNCRLIKESVAVNGYRHVVLHETAVSFEDGAVRYCNTPGTTNCSVFSDKFRDKYGENHFGYVPQEVIVPMTTVDKLIPNGRIDIVKIDVEGYELNVFRGMTRILQTSQPTILLEFFPSLLQEIGATEPSELLDFLRGQRYELRELIDPSGKALTNAEIMARVASEPLTDLIASPRG